MAIFPTLDKRDLRDMDIIGKVFFRNTHAGQQLTMTMIRRRLDGRGGMAPGYALGTSEKERGQRIMAAIDNLRDTGLIKVDTMETGHGSELLFSPSNDIKGWMKLREEAIRAETSEVTA